MDSVGLARVAIVLLVVAGCFQANPSRGADAYPMLRVDVWADRDDDDANARPDCEQNVLRGAALIDLVELDKRIVGARLEVISGGEHARIVLTTGVAFPWGRVVPVPGWFQGLSPGTVELMAKAPAMQIRISVRVRGLDMVDGRGETVDMARSHASLNRLPPESTYGPAAARFEDDDALRAVMAIPDNGTDVDGDRAIAVESLDSLGRVIDALPNLPLATSACARPYSDVRCWTSPPLRLVVDDVDRDHPLVAGRSIKAEVGGAIVFRKDGTKAQMIRVLGPRASPAGPIGRLKATLRGSIVRIVPGGAPALGRTDADAIRVLRAEMFDASGIWGQCGLSFGDPRWFEARVIDPPPPHLISLGDDLGIAASGGEIRVRAGGAILTVPTRAGDSPGRVASNVARAAERAGLLAIVSPNARIGPGLASSVDVSIRKKDGALVALDTVPRSALSTDATMSVRIGSVDLTDGLKHFTDVDAVAGSLEERTLLKALDDREPGAIEVVVVPFFEGGGRIGESFIGSDSSSLRNIVLIDRAGIRVRKSSLTLAHEIGHVLMDFPGHADDYQQDMPTRLMDSDAADASPFGPRRITLEECARVVRQSGPLARTPLLIDWPIAPIPGMAAPRP